MYLFFSTCYTVLLVLPFLQLIMSQPEETDSGSHGLVPLPHHPTPMVESLLIFLIFLNVTCKMFSLTSAMLVLLWGLWLGPATSYKQRLLWVGRLFYNSFFSSFHKIWGSTAGLLLTLAWTKSAVQVLYVFYSEVELSDQEERLGFDAWERGIPSWNSHSYDSESYHAFKFPSHSKVHQLLPIMELFTCCFLPNPISVNRDMQFHPILWFLKRK